MRLIKSDDTRFASTAVAKLTVAPFVDALNVRRRALLSKCTDNSLLRYVGYQLRG